MAEWHEALWEAQWAAPSRADRRSGRYHPYSPDLLGQRALRLSSDIGELAWRAESEVRRLGDRPGSRGLEALARFLLRSEAIASSRIEGLRVAPQQVGLAELAEEEGFPKQGAGATARMVAANITAVRHATAILASEQVIEVRHVEQLQEATAAYPRNPPPPRTSSSTVLDLPVRRAAGTPPARSRRSCP